MKKIPTVFVREFEDHKPRSIHNEFTSPEVQEAFEKGTATVKFDGACCAVCNGKLYKRYDAKHGKTPPQGAIPCCDPDPITGHWPHWVLVDAANPADKWFFGAFNNSWTPSAPRFETYEAIGPHFQGNPYGLDEDVLVLHGSQIVEVERTFEGVREYLREHYIEGLVFWYGGVPVCKIKRSDFGFEWR